MTIPWHVTLSAPITYPSIHRHMKSPSLFSHSWLHRFVGISHSLISIKWKYSENKRQMKMSTCPPFVHLFQLLYSCHIQNAWRFFVDYRLLQPIAIMKKLPLYRKLCARLWKLSCHPPPANRKEHVASQPLLFW